MNRFAGVFFCAALLIAPLSAHSLTLKKGETLGSDGRVKAKSESGSSETSGINTYGGGGYISENETPNFTSLRWSLYRKIYYRPLQAHRFHSVEGVRSYEFKKNLREAPYVREQMNTTPLLSYLLFEGGEITVDEVSPSNRFGDMFSDKTMYHSMSMGKSITSFLVGHAICDGTIDSLNMKLNDWPVLEGTLYHGQELSNFLNMATGDQKYSENDESPLSIQARMATEFAGTKKSRSVYNYTNLNTNIVISYLLHKYGEQGFKDFLDDVFANRVGIQHEIWLNKNSGAKKNEQSLGHQFFATRYDYLRIAKSMLDEWQRNSCVGQYLKSIHQNRISKNGAQGTRGRVGLPRGYAGFFHTSYKGMKNRAVMGMDGNGGQTILIDFERGRIVATLSVFDGMRFPRQGSFDYKRISYDVIKNGSPLSNEHQKGSATITSDEIRSANVARRTQHESAKQKWDDYYDEIFFGSKKLGSIILSEDFEKKGQLAVSDYDDNWVVEKLDGGNLVYCNKPRNSWTEFNFGEGNWSDYSITYRLKFFSGNEGEVETHIRKANRKDYRLEIHRQSVGFFVGLLGKQYPADIPAEDWMVIELMAVGTDIKASINGKEIVSATDGRYKKGGGMIAVSANVKACVDDIVARKM